MQHAGGSNVHVARSWWIVALALLAVAVLAALSPGKSLRAPSVHALPVCTTDCYVSPAGDNGNDGTFGSPFATVQHAVDTVQPGGTVHVMAGTYTEQVTVTTALKIEGDGTGLTTIQMPNPTYGNVASIIVNAGDSDTVEVTNLTVSTNNVCGAAIDVAWGNINVHDTVISAPNPNGLCVSVGINLDKGQSTITNNTITGYTGAGVWLFGSSTAIISNNTITGGTSNLGQQMGVGVEVDAGATITGNTISGNQCIQSTYPPPHEDQNTCDYGLDEPQMASGISIDTTGNVTATGNTLTSNDIGVVVYSGGTVGVSDNNLTNTYIGLLTLASAMRFDGNAVNGGEYGIVVVSFADESAIVPALNGTGNTISGNGTGIYVFKFADVSAAPDPVVTLNRNAITGNTTGYNNTSGADQDATCNWWGAASGPSGEGPGAGDSASSDVTYTPWLVGSDLANSPCTGTPVSATTITASAAYYDLAPVPTVAITAHVDSSNSSIYDESGTGTVSFYNGATLLCTVPLEYGQAVCESAINPASGSSHALIVVYNGTSGFLPSSTTTDVVAHLARPTLVSAAAVTPNTGAAWLVRGGGFSGATSVTACGVAVPFTVVNDNIVLVGVPAVNAPKQCTVTITAAGGTGSSAGTLTVVPKPQPGAPVVVFPNGPSTPPPAPDACDNATTITVSGQWTLVAWAGEDGISVAAALSQCNDITSQVSVIWAFDAATQTYHAYFPSATNVPGANDLATLTQGLGYWVGLADPASGNVTWNIAAG